MEPVEIDFIVNPNDSSQRIDSVRNSIAGLGTAADDALRKLKDRFAEESQALKQVEIDIKNIEKAYSKAAPGAGKIELGQELTAAKQALQEQKVIVADLKAQTDAASQAQASFRTQLRLMREELVAMAQAGEAGSAAYVKLQKDAAALQDAIDDVSQATRTLANDQSAFQGVVSGLSGIAGGMSAAAGAAALFGAQSEDLAKIQTRLQSLMAITVGLQQVSATLNKESAFQLVVVAGAKRAWAAAVQFLNVQLGISVGLSKALMASGIGLLLAGVGLLVAKIIEWRKNQETANRVSEEAKKKAQELAAAQDKIAGDYAKQKAAVESLRAALHSETLSYDKKLACIKKLQEIIPNYNAELSKEGVVIKENTAALDAYMAALEKSLKLKAATEQLEVLYKKQYEIERMEQDPAAVEAEVQKRMPARDVVYRQTVGSGDTYAKYLTPEERKKMVDESMANEYSKNKADVQREAVMERTNIRLEIEKIQKYIGDNNLVALAKPETGAAKDRTKQDFYNAQRDIEALLRDINAKTAALQMQLMKDSLQKRLMLLDNEEAAELQKIAEREQKIVDEYNKSHGTKYNNIEQFDAAGAKNIEQERASLTAEYAAKRVDIEKQANAQIIDIQKSLIDAQAPQLERQLNEIQAKYAQMRRQAMSNSKDGKIDVKTSIAIESAEKTDTQKVLGSMLSQYKTYFNERKNLETQYEQDMKELNAALLYEEEDVVKASMARRKEEYLKSIAALEKEHKGKNNAFFGIGDTVKRIRELRKELAQVRLNPEASAQAQELGEQLDRAIDDFNTKFFTAGEKAVAAFKQVGQVVGDINKELGETIDEMAQVADAFMNIVKGIASENYVTAIAGVVQMIGALIKGQSEADRKFQLAVESREREKLQRYLGDSHILRMALDRQTIENAINKSRLQVIDEEKKLLALKSAELKKDMQKLLNTLNQQTYTAYIEKTYREPNRGGAIQRYTVQEQKNISTYTNGAKDLDEAIFRLKELEAKGGLSENQIKILQEMEINQQLYNAALEDTIRLEEERKELLTGTTSSGLLDGIVQGLKAGKKTMEDFADSAEDALRNALWAAVTQSLDQKAIDLYKDFLAKAVDENSEDGEDITAEEAQAFREAYKKIGEDAAKNLEHFQQMMGVDAFADTQGSTALTGAIKGITENTASLLAGQMNGIRINVVQQLERMGAILAAVQGIKSDTGQYLPYLQSINTGIAALQSSMQRGV